MNLFSHLRNSIQYLSDKRIVDTTYKLVFHKKIHWKHPTTYNEKVQIFKISDEAEKLWSYVDKYEVRKFVTREIGEQYLIPLLGVYDHVQGIDLAAFPNAFIMKTTHGSGWNILCRNKKTFDWEDAKKNLNLWMNSNYYQSFSRERQYKNIKPRIIIEQYIETKDKELMDIKFFCFNGKPQFMNIITGRFSYVSKAFYDMNWKRLPIRSDEACAEGIYQKPKKFNEMIQIARKLSAKFKHVRVDLYNRNGKIYFGELTFSSSSGFKVFNPPEYDEIFGKYYEPFP